jgi:tRNA U34 5-methylaminomethyl-2-thiouridine-forming methyltransferase MnmC
MDEHFHSINGAISESMHIYINYGLLSHNSEEISILEVGFGTGLNALLSAIEAAKRGIRIYYKSIDKYPLQQEILDSLNYCDQLMGESEDIYKRIKSAPWNCDVKIDNQFTLHKVETDLLEFDSKAQYDIIYYDAFGPEKQPEIWEESVLEKFARMVQPGGLFVTYSAIGRLKRVLQAAGMKVQHLPGPAGKREITRAVNSKI